jgi:hypothetical protein
MIQGSQNPGLPFETGHALGIFDKDIGQDLQGHVATELVVARPVNIPHAARAQLFGDAVMSDGLTDQNVSTPMLDSADGLEATKG